MRGAPGIAWVLAACVAGTAPAFAQQAQPSGGIAAPGLGPEHQEAMQGNAGGALMVDTPATQSAASIMTIDQNAVFLRSDWGLRAKAATETHMSQINAENERLISQFAAEEQELTQSRATLPPDEFRKRADDFDKRVSQARRDTERQNDRFEADFQSERTAFFRAALPVLARIMRDRGGLVVLDQSAIFVAAQSVDVNVLLIQRVNAEIGAGPATDAGTPPAEAASSPTQTPATATPPALPQTSVPPAMAPAVPQVGTAP